MTSDSISTSTNNKEMIIRTREEWNALLAKGANVLYETKYCKIFSMPDGTLWRTLPKYRRAWEFDNILYAKLFL